MLLYFAVLIASVSLSAAALSYPAVYQVRIAKSGRLVELKVRNILFALSFVPMFLTSAVRYKVGVDYNNYAWIFKAINQTNEKTHVEIGYELLNRFIGWFTTHPEVLFVVTSAIIIFFFARGILENSSCIPYSIFLFIALGYFFYSMNSIRHFMALSIYFFALRYMKKQKFLKYLLCILLASTLHKVCLLYTSRCV